MKKSLIYLLLVSASASFVYATDYEATQNASDVKGAYDNLIFKNSEVEIGASGTLRFTNAITVNSGVKDVVLYTSYASADAGNFAVNAGQDGTNGLKISGAGKASSELTLGTHIFNAGTSNLAEERVDATIDKITLNFGQLSYKGTTLQSNEFRANNFIINEATVNVLAGSTTKIQLNSSCKLKINENGILNIYGTLDTAGNSVYVYSGGKFHVQSGGVFSSTSFVQGSGEIVIDGYYNASKVRLDDGGKLVLNASNVTSKSGYQATNKTPTVNGVAGLGCINIYGANTEIEINAQNKLGGFCANFIKANKTITLTFGDRGDADYLLYLEYLIYKPGDNYYENNVLSGSSEELFYNLKDFTTGDLVLDAKITDAQIEAAQSHFLLDSETGKITFEKQNINGTNYWVATAVPEPAEWAVIFGAIALAFVAYRRR